MRGILRSFFSALVAAVVVCPVLARADAFVYVRYTGFSPASVSIGVGETVYFIQDDDFGPYCIQSTTGAWTPWYLFEEGDGFGLTFNQRGDYNYRDTFTWHTGVIHVGTTVPNNPPAVTINTPAEGAVFTAPASVQVSANALDPDSGIWAVEFYLDSALVDTVYAAPFTTTILNVSEGEHVVTVTAYDNLMSSTSRSVNIKVQPPAAPAIRISPPALVAAEFRFSVSGLTVGRKAVLEACTMVNAGAWTAVQTNSITEETMIFSRPVTPGNAFFRVWQTD